MHGTGVLRARLRLRGESRRSAEVVFRMRLELIEATLGAEVVRLAVVIVLARRFRRIDRHAANGILRLGWTMMMRMACSLAADRSDGNSRMLRHAGLMAAAEVPHRFLLERVGAVLGAEIVGLATVVDLRGRGRGLDGHAADRIDFAHFANSSMIGHSGR